MGKGPGLYSDIGKRARDLLYRDYQSDQKFTITTYSPTGVALTSTGTKKGELFLADINAQLKNKNITTDVKVDTSSNLFTTVTIDEPAPGLKAILNFRVPDQRSGKLEVQYLHEHAGISSNSALDTTSNSAPCSSTLTSSSSDNKTMGNSADEPNMGGCILELNVSLLEVDEPIISYQLPVSKWKPHNSFNDI
ncbi:mitochondrial outer membrane protein porin of 34 kDa-like [Olea europaea var. sylvestris]|uniref:mitochondrial outer membrane protein porin of 34 kDa-like n=1 Tax=Olea europaea var. sylvestris TaxID=158386 RepID=UPI000C1D7E98|nr:mitochondrial outer membrane protein porin of 34 kDa-like [Olea europaea var. sylvestris]